jgi:flagellar biosynthesis/type III secretory pathway M-ring protein FliF/YscJ
MFNFNKKLNIKYLLKSNIKYLLIFILITLLFYCIFNKFKIIETKKHGKKKRKKQQQTVPGDDESQADESQAGDAPKVNSDSEDKENDKRKRLMTKEKD